MVSAYHKIKKQDKKFKICFLFFKFSWLEMAEIDRSFDPKSFTIHDAIFDVYRHFLYSKGTFLSFDKHYIDIINKYFDIHAFCFQLEAIEEILLQTPTNNFILQVKEDLKELRESKKKEIFVRNVYSEEEFFVRDDVSSDEREGEYIDFSGPQDELVIKELRDMLFI